MSSKSNIGWHLKDYHTHRNLIKSHMMLACNEWSGWRFVTPTERSRIVDDIERGCYEHSVSIYKKTVNSFPIWDTRFDGIYQVITCKIMLNLGNVHSNAHGDAGSDTCDNVLLRRIINGELNPVELGAKTEAEMIPEPGEEIRKEWELRKETKIKKNYVQGKKCPKCKNTDKIDFNQAQKTSLDDGYISIGFVCENCGNTWQ